MLIESVLMIRIVLFFSILLSFLSLDCAVPTKEWVLVVGGAGFIGSSVNEMLYDEGYPTVVLDNLSTGNKAAVQHGIFIKGDMTDSETLHQIFSKYPISAVMHFAGVKQVGESISNPLKYYINNVSDTLTLLQEMKKHNVHFFIFSSSAAIYGLPLEEYVTEGHPKNPINPYGQSKLMVETILQDLDRANYGFKYCSLRYFNAAGGDPKQRIKNCMQNEASLIPVVLRSVQGPAKTVTIFGTDYPTPDGTGIRDYVHIEDLASAHIKALKRLLKGAPSACYNLGNGKGFSVREVIAAVEKVTGKKVQVVEGDRRIGDPPAMIASSKKAQEELEWHPKHTDLVSIIQDAWNAMKVD